MSEVQSGDIVLVNFPFTDLTGAKIRPAVVISRETVHRKEDDYTLLFISSVIPNRPEPYEVLFPLDHPDFEASGLKKESLFKANKIATVQKRLLQRKIGKLGSQIAEEIRRAMGHALFV